jgi:hypothetical protein
MQSPTFNYPFFPRFDQYSVRLRRHETDIFQNSPLLLLPFCPSRSKNYGRHQEILDVDRVTQVHSLEILKSFPTLSLLSGRVSRLSPFIFTTDRPKLLRRLNIIEKMWRPRIPTTNAFLTILSTKMSFIFCSSFR